MPAPSAPLLLLCVAALVAVATAPPSGQHLARYEANRRQVMRFKCKDPQPRALLSSNLTRVEPYEHVDPPYTVLHRCDAGSGCCATNTVCGVLHSQEVTLVFAVTNRVRNDGKVEFREVTQTNHTQCQCVDREPQPPR